MIKVVILGTGNVASHFIKAFSKSKNAKVKQIYNHNQKTLEKFSNFDTTTNLNNIQVADVYLICVKDDKVKDIAKAIQQPKAIIAHTSGSLPLLDTSCRDAVFYPLQTFTKDRKISFVGLPICIETKQIEDFEKLKDLATGLQAKVYNVNSLQRQNLHLAAVFVCNFVNHLYHIGHEICSEKDLSFDILKPLIQETAEKIKTENPKNSQTGPARRHDQSTINRHIYQLEHSNYQEIYRYLTNSIQKTYE